MNCQCGNPSAQDCSYASCKICCPGCERHPSSECCEICDMPMHECDCVECNYYDCYCRVPSDSEYCCANCGPMCVDCFGNPYVCWVGDTYCEICGNGMANGGSDNSGPEENW